MNSLISAGNETHLLSAEEAQDLLKAFLEIQRREFPNVHVGNVSLDFSQGSVSCALRHVAQENQQYSEYQGEFFKLWGTRLGYYFGEALCRVSPNISWGIGESGTAFENHPVIQGFSSGEEAAVITICMNVILAVAIDGVPATRIDGAVDHWFEMARS